MRKIKHTPYNTMVTGLKALAEIGDMAFVNSMKKQLNHNINKSYIPSKDKELMAYMSDEEKKEFITLSL